MPNIKGFRMEKGFQSFFLFILILPFHARAIDGTAVTCAFRWANYWKTYPELPLWRYNPNSRYTGKIVRIDIENSAVVRRDTVYKETRARYPTLSPDGKKIAFLRLSCHEEDGELVDKEDKCFFTVMNTDGSNRHDLVSMPMGGGRTSMDWPHGEWIYYQKMDTYEIWRVNVVEPAHNERVAVYDEFRKWELSADARYAVIQTIYDGKGGKGTMSTPHLFPPSKHPVHLGGYRHLPGCNGTISPSGAYLGLFINTGHTELFLRYWDPVADTTHLIPSLVDDPNRYWGQSSVHVLDMLEWYGDSVGRQMDWPRWSANSDKWVCLNIGLVRATAKSGSNQVLMNWVDHEIIMTSDNPMEVDAETTVGCTAGDLWVRGPEGHYENVAGDWAPVGTDGIRTTGVAHSRGGTIPAVARPSIRLVFPLTTARVEIRDAGGTRYSMRGRRMRYSEGR